MSETEDQVRDALAAYAASTSTSPDAWDRTVARAARPQMRARAARIVAAAFVAVLVVAGVTVAVAHRPSAPTIARSAEPSTHHPDQASFFSIRPVLRQLAPPCPPESPATGATVLPEMNGGAVLACYEVGPAAVDAQDVASASPVQDPNGAWSVQFSLTADGTARFNALAALLGSGAQVAMVVDGVVLAAPRLDTTSFPGVGLITGVDAAGAQELAARLHR